MELAPGRWHTGGMKTPRSIDSFAEIATARIAIEGADPPIWREVELPTSITLKVLHDIVQATMGWMDYHLWEFVIDGRTYGLPDDEDWGTAPRKEAAKVRLRDVLKPGETVITYTYDFGDDWVHTIRITDIRQGEPGIVSAAEAELSPTIATVSAAITAATAFSMAPSAALSCASAPSTGVSASVARRAMVTIAARTTRTQRILASIRARPHRGQCRTSFAPIHGVRRPTIARSAPACN